MKIKNKNNKIPKNSKMVIGRFYNTDWLIQEGILKTFDMSKEMYIKLIMRMFQNEDPIHIVCQDSYLKLTKAIIKFLDACGYAYEYDEPVETIDWNEKKQMEVPVTVFVLKKSSGLEKPK